MILLKLTLKQFLVRKARTILTIIAVALAVSLVVSTTSGYSSLLAGIHHFVDARLGHTDAQIQRQGQGAQDFTQSVVTQLRADPRVRMAVGRLETTGQIPGHTSLMGGGANLVGIDRASDDQVDQLRVVAGKWFTDATGNYAVIDQGAVQALHAKVGGEIEFPSLNGELKLKVVGVIHKPAIVAGHVRTVYVPLQTLQRWLYPKNPDVVSQVMINLRAGQNLKKFVADWQKRLEKIDPALHIQTSQNVEQNLDKNLQGLQLLSLMGGAVSMGAAAFILFSALSMGVLERQRVLAMMRAIGAVRRQIGWLVVIEGLILAIFGIIIGIPLGWVWVKILSLYFKHLFVAGVVLSHWGVILAVVGSMVSALVASFLPAWNAMRVEPLKAMTPLSAAPTAKVPWISALVGLFLIAIDPVLLYVPWHKIASGNGLRAIQVYGHIGVGIIAIFIGFFMLAPGLIAILEKAIGPAIAWILRIRFSLLRQQLSGGVWRSAGTAAAMMVGLAVLVVMQVHGTSLLDSWSLPDKFPDIFIYSTTNQMKLSDMPEVASIPGIKQVMPITVASPEFGTNIFSIGVGLALVPNATMFFGIDPNKAFDMMNLEFTVGNAKTAEELLKKGGYVIVTDEFRKLKGLTVGDTIALKTTHGIHNFKIAGVIWSPGIDVMVAMFDLGKQFQQRTIASVFGSVADAKKYFGVTGVYVFAANLTPGIPRQTVLKRIRQKLGMMGLEAGDVRQIKAELQKNFANLLLLAGTVAFAAMAVASLGVINTIMASVRSRLWQFGVLRSIGVTRSQLLRLVLAEVILLAIVGCSLGLAAGMEMAICAKAVAAISAGLTISTVFPWKVIGAGVGVMIGITLIAGAIPAIGVALRKPLDLLQAGRAAG